MILSRLTSFVTDVLDGQDRADPGFKLGSRGWGGYWGNSHEGRTLNSSCANNYTQSLLLPVPVLGTQVLEDWTDPPPLPLQSFLPEMHVLLVF